MPYRLNILFLPETKYTIVMPNIDYSLVTRDNNIITIHSLINNACVNSFLYQIFKCTQKAGYEDIIINFDKNIGHFPNAITPICGIVDYFKNIGVNFEGQSYNSSLQTILTPCELPSSKLELSRPLGKVWKFQSSNDVCEIQAAIINELRRSDEFASGILEGIEWSINEIMDNVLNHSKSDCGFIMGQVYKTSKHVAFTIYDSGIGIYNSLKNSPHAPRNNADALSLCLKEGVTRDIKVGQGNGMCGLFSLVKEGNGRLVLSSGADIYQYIEGKDEILYNQNMFPSKEAYSTTVDFQLDYSKNISIDRVLTFNGRTFKFINLYLENLENNAGELVFKIAELAEGTGTRESALRLKNEILNLMRTNKQKAILDFSGINVVTSSFIDELIAKLLVELGLFQFNNYIKLSNMTNIVQQTLEKSIIQRIIEEYK